MDRDHLSDQRGRCDGSSHHHARIRPRDLFAHVSYVVEMDACMAFMFFHPNGKWFLARDKWVSVAHGGWLEMALHVLKCMALVHPKGWLSGKNISYALCGYLVVYEGSGS